MKRLNEKAAIVTGAGQGTGKGIALALAYALNKEASPSPPDPIPAAIPAEPAAGRGKLHRAAGLPYTV